MSDAQRSAVGLTPSFLRTARRGMVAVDQRISDLRKLHAGDTVSIAIGVSEVHPSASCCSTR